jgi:hypothetical protein
MYAGRKWIADLCDRCDEPLGSIAESVVFSWTLNSKERPCITERNYLHPEVTDVPWAFGALEAFLLLPTVALPKPDMLLKSYGGITDWLVAWLTDWLTPCSRVLLEKLTVPHLVKKLSAFYGTRRFINAFTSARHLSLSWTKQIQSMLPISLLQDPF